MPHLGASKGSLALKCERHQWWYTVNGGDPLLLLMHRNSLAREMGNANVTAAISITFELKCSCQVGSMSHIRSNHLGASIRHCSLCGPSPWTSSHDCILNSQNLWRNPHPSFCLPVTSFKVCAIALGMKTLAHAVVALPCFGYWCWVVKRGANACINMWFAHQEASTMHGYAALIRRLVLHPRGFQIAKNWHSSDP